MQPDFGEAYQEQLQEPPKKSNTSLIIIIVVLVLLCCCCVVFGGGIAAWFLGDSILEGLTLQLGQLFF